MPLVLKVSIINLALFNTLIADDEYKYLDLLIILDIFQLKTFFEFSKRLEGMVPKILNALCDRKTANSLPRDGKVQSVGAERAAEQLDVHQVK